MVIIARPGAKRVMSAAQAQVDKEAANRAAFQRRGELGLDWYDLRDRLGESNGPTARPGQLWARQLARFMIRLSWVRVAAAVLGGLRAEYISTCARGIVHHVYVRRPRSGPQTWIARPFTKRLPYRCVLCTRQLWSSGSSGLRTVIL